MQCSSTSEGYLSYENSFCQIRIAALPFISNLQIITIECLRLVPVLGVGPTMPDQILLAVMGMSIIDLSKAQ
jgi:hypothetical protein